MAIQNHQEALALTPQYRLPEKNVESADMQRKMEVSSHMPNVAIGAGYLYMDVMNSGNWTGAIFATVSVPLSDWWGGSHGIKRQKIAYQSVREQLDDAGEQLLILMDKNWIAVEDEYRLLQLE